MTVQAVNTQELQKLPEKWWLSLTSISPAVYKDASQCMSEWLLLLCSLTVTGRIGCCPSIYATVLVLALNTTSAVG